MLKKIDYAKILKKSFRITIENKFLWLFGLMLALGGGGTSFNFNFPSGGSSDEKIDEMTYMNAMRKVTYYWEMYKELIILGIVLLVLLGIAFYVLALIARGGLIGSIFKILKNEEVNFKKGFKEGAGYLGRMFLISLATMCSSIGLLVILAVPVIRLFVLKSYVAGSILGIFALFIFITFIILLSFLIRYAEIYLVSSNLGAYDSMKLGYRLFEKNIGNSLLMGLVFMGINFVVGMGILVMLFVLGIPTMLIGIVIYGVAGKTVSITLLILAVLLFMFLMIFISAVMNVFAQAVWILFFEEIARENNEENIAPEIVKEEKEEIAVDSSVEVEGVYNSKD